LVTDQDYKEIAEKVCLQIEKDLVVIKPYLINIIQYGKKKLTEKDANEIIRTMVSEKVIDENLALSKNGKPYSFYTIRCDRLTIDKIIEPIKVALIQKKKLTISEISKITGYSTIATRVLLTHLLFVGEVDYSGDLEMPLFYFPWG
jgi:hypothetical protein